MASWDIRGSSSDRHARMMSIEWAVANPYSRRILSIVSLSTSSSRFQKRSAKARCIAVPETLKNHSTLTIYRRLTPGTWAIQSRSACVSFETKVSLRSWNSFAVLLDLGILSKLNRAVGSLSNDIFSHMELLPVCSGLLGGVLKVGGDKCVPVVMIYGASVANGLNLFSKI